MQQLQELQHLVNQGFSKRNLYKSLTICNQLLKTHNNKLSIFTIKGIFRDLLDFYEDEPVIVEEEQELTSDIADMIINILRNLDQINIFDLKNLVSQYQNNKTFLNKNS